MTGAETADNRQLATRVMKARRPGTCPLCRGPIQVGQQIAKIGFWCHAQCVIDCNQATRKDDLQ